MKETSDNSYIENGYVSPRKPTVGSKINSLARGVLFGALMMSGCGGEGGSSTVIINPTPSSSPHSSASPSPTATSTPTGEPTEPPYPTASPTGSPSASPTPTPEECDWYADLEVRSTQKMYAASYDKWIAGTEQDPYYFEGEKTEEIDLEPNVPAWLPVKCSGSVIQMRIKGSEAATIKLGDELSDVTWQIRDPFEKVEEGEDPEYYYEGKVLIASDVAAGTDFYILVIPVIDQETGAVTLRQIMWSTSPFSMPQQYRK